MPSAPGQSCLNFPLLMILTTLYLHQFRNYIDTKIDFSDGVTLFVGKNGNGKTNILEAIFLSILGKTFRGKKEHEMIAWEKPIAHVQARFIEQHVTQKREVVISSTEKNKKLLKIDEVLVKPIDYIGSIYCVLFSPEDMNLIDGEPSLRRRYLDVLLSQVDYQYAYSLAKYNKILKMRNKLLQSLREGKAQHDELHFWDKHIIEYGQYVVDKRKIALDFFNEKTSSLYQEMSDSETSLGIEYIGTTGKEYTETLKKRIHQDIAQGSTSVGPHRDDFQYILQGKDLRTFGSRGEYRSVILVLKMLEILYIQDTKKTSPLLLLDDVFSELDVARRSYLLGLVSDQQTIITTTDIDNDLVKYMSTMNNALLYEVHEGKVRLKS